MSNLILLFVVCFHLVHLVFLFRFDVGGVITAVVNQLLLHGEIHDMCTNRVEKVLRVGCDDENVVVGGKVSFKPNNGAEIEMIGRLVKEKKMGLNEQGPSESHTHSPTTGHILGRFLHHFWTETETIEYTTRFSLECIGIQFF